MKGFELKKILNRIKTEENTTITEIAAKAGVDRGLLSTATNKGKELPVTENTIEKLTDAYPKYFSTNSTKSKEKAPGDPGLSIKDAQYIGALAYIRALSDAVVKLQATVYNRSILDCHQELEQTAILLAERMKTGDV